MSKHRLDENDSSAPKRVARDRIVLDVSGRTHTIASNVSVFDPSTLTQEPSTYSHIVWKNETTPVADLRTLFGRLQAYEPGLTDEIERMTRAIPDQTITDNQFEDNTDLKTFRFPKKLKAIGASAFKGCTGLAHVDLSECTLLTSIGKGAFQDCTSLVSVVLPPACKVICNNAFQNCTSLHIFEFPDGLELIGNHAFEGNESMINCVFPTTLETIGESAFEDCTNLVHLSVNESSREVSTDLTFLWIEDRAFKGCIGLVHIDLGELILINALGVSVFQDCTALESIILPSVCESIGDYAFELCTSLQIISLPPSIKWIGFGSFLSSGLTSIHIPALLDRIEEDTFASCHDLHEVTIDLDADLTLIKDNAFYDTALTRFTGNRKLKTIMLDAFHGCEQLKVVDLGNCVHDNPENVDESYGIHGMPATTLVVWPRQPDDVQRVSRGNAYEEIDLPEKAVSI